MLLGIHASGRNQNTPPKMIPIIALSEFYSKQYAIMDKKIIKNINEENKKKYIAHAKFKL